MNKIEIVAIPALKDNYIWLIIDRVSLNAVAVDPGDAAPLINFIEENNINLSAVLITHHHRDHCYGLEELTDRYQFSIYGPKHNDIKGVSHYVNDQDILNLKSPVLSLNVIGIPGHTLEHVAYRSQNYIFCGDTLFSAGCGRIFEGTAEQMYSSIKKIASLDDSIDIYCGHEYTLKNLQFAEIVDPKNQEIQEKICAAKELMGKNQPTLPAKLHQEKRINPFLRCEEKVIIESVENYAGIRLRSSVEVFSQLRNWKDNF
jgi:hydroxyacylglutathione hydrolase